jgi:hypothetical protein
MAYASFLELDRSRPRALSEDRIDPSASASAPMTAAASFLAYLGAAPLLGASLLIVVDHDRFAAVAEPFLVLYSAALIIFFGGVRWGVAVMRQRGPTMRHLIGAAAPLLAALPLFGPGPATVKIVAIMALILILLIDDLHATRRGGGAPLWYLGVRVPLTVLIEVALLVALAAGLRN